MGKRKSKKTKQDDQIDAKTVKEEKNEEKEQLNTQTKSSPKSSNKKQKPSNKKTKQKKANEKLEANNNGTTSNNLKTEEEPKPLVPNTDVIEIFNKEYDKEWGFGFEFKNDKVINSIWKEIEEKYSALNNKQYSYIINWFSQDSEGFMPGEVKKQFLVIWCWGMVLEEVKKEFKTYFPKISGASKTYRPSPDLGSEYWMDMPKENELKVEGLDTVILPKNSPRRVSPVPEELMKSVPSKIPRYWRPKQPSRPRDWSIPVISHRSFVNGQKEIEGYLEEYIVEQIEYKILESPKKKKIGIILPKEFDPSEDSEKKFDIPFKYNQTPKFDYGNFGNMGNMIPPMDLPDLDEEDENLNENDGIIDQEPEEIFDSED